MRRRAWGSARKNNAALPPANPRISRLYRELLHRHGRPAGQWSVWCKRPKTGVLRERVMVEAVLTQRTNWRNVELAIRRLKERGICRIGSIASAQPAVLHECIRPAGFYRGKADCLRSLARYVLKHGGVRGLIARDLSELRGELLHLHGVGPETADSILLYALDKPVFVIDEYTRRLLRNKRISYGRSYALLQSLFERSVRKDFRLYQDFHALIVIDGKRQL